MHPSRQDLCSIPIFKDLPDDAIEWLREHMTVLELAPGEVLVRAGAAADRLWVLFEGEVHGERDGDPRVFIARAGQVTGMLPYSRLTTISLTVRAAMRSRGAQLHKDDFPEMLQRIPILQQRLVSVLADRIRETARADQQREKLMALGKLSAGLAHELNNPASAAIRAAHYLRDAAKDFRSANLQLGKLEISKEARLFLSQVEYDFAERTAPQASMDTLERSDREETLALWLESVGVKEAWRLAPALVDAGFTADALKPVAKEVPREFLGVGFLRLTASVSITRLVDEIESSMKKISELVRAVKEYSYMDQMPEQDVDIHDGIENTLVMLRHRLKNGIEVTREYDRSIPRISARGSELNQIWTNLITNAIDAMGEKGKLQIQTTKEPDKVLVQITDSGRGIPSEIKDRIFEPFFTTKGVNEGTGLGLDIAGRIVHSHGGDIRFESEPGRTRFCVWLPLQRNGHSPEDQATRNSG